MSSSIAAQLEQALRHHGSRQFEIAEKLYREVLRTAPNHPDAQHLLGVLLHQRGDAAGGEALIRKAIAGNPRAANYRNNLANVLASQGKLMEAAQVYEDALSVNPDDALVHVNLGYILKGLGRLDAAIEHYRRALELHPNLVDAHNKLGVILTQKDRLGEAAQHFYKAINLMPDNVEARANLANVLRAEKKLDEAAEQYTKALEIKHDFPEMLCGLGLVRKEQGRLNEAADYLRRAIKLRPDYAEAHHGLGDIRMDQGRLSEAEKHYKRALQADPNFAEALSHYGMVMRQRGQLADAQASFERAIKVRPDFAEGLSNMGVALMDLGKREAAEPYLIRALELRPDFAEALHNLGLLRFLQARLDEAEELFRAALERRPDYPEVHNNLGLLLKDKGRAEEAIQMLRHALELRPDYADAHTSLIFTLDFLPSAGFVEHQAERRRWYELHGKRFANAARPHGNDRNPDRKLRVGYVSADFRQHSAVYCFGPILRNHDHSAVHVTCYSGVTREDSTTAELRRVADRWRSTVGVPDDDVAQMIREDEIDILVDLSGHSQGNRLLVFARKPAPIQVTAWGHSTGTGLATIDYLFADPIAAPPEIRHLFAEAIYDLPCILAYEAPNYAPDVTPLPALSGAPLTFGSLNRLSKVPDSVLAVWARILAAIPGSRLLVKDRQLSMQAERERIVGVFERHGIPGSRLMFEGGTVHAAHLAAYGQVDIALDPFPQCGGMTTMEALWMGVPLISLLGNSIPSRAGATMLSASGLGDWYARSEEEYVEIAVRKSADLDALAELRREMRARISRTPVANPKLYTQAVEAAYRDMWRRWCTGAKPV